MAPVREKVTRPPEAVLQGTWSHNTFAGPSPHRAAPFGDQIRNAQNEKNPKIKNFFSAIFAQKRHFQKSRCAKK
jgi:hypothetical protein